jgi:hypothetical protein
MSHLTIQVAFYISLILILPIGGILMFKWGKRIVKPIAKDIDNSKHVQVEGIAFKTFIYMIPALLVFALFAAPVLYFGSLQKKESYCKELIRFNKLKKTDPILKERCSCLDIDELFQNAKN